MPTTPAALLCVVHPLPDVRRQVLSHFPDGLSVCEAATVAELSAWPSTGTRVVLFDPARTAPADVREAGAGPAELVSISELRLPVPEVGVDAARPLRRISAQELARVVFEATERQTLAVAR